jgi:hypothetical protein
MAKHWNLIPCVLILSFILMTSPLRAAEPVVSEVSPEVEQSLTEVNMKLTNPVSEIWSISAE